MDKIEFVVDNLLSPEALKIPFVSQIFIITTISPNGIINAEINTSVAHAVTEPPMLSFSCNMGHDTCHNVLEQGEFVINIPGERIVDKIMVIAKEYPPEVNELDEAKLRYSESCSVEPPRVDACVAHFECQSKMNKIFDDEIIFLGKVVNAAISRDIYEVPVDVRFSKARPIIALGDWRYSTICEVKKIP